MKHHILLSIFAFILFSIATLAITWSLIFHLTDWASGEFVIAWITNWNIHSILTGNILGIFNANIYYPFQTSLAYSTPFFTSSIIALPFFLLLKEPIVPSNITFLTSLALLGFTTYLLSYYVTKNFLASLLAGFLVMFCPLTLDKKIHLQVLSLQWIPLSFLFFLHYCKTGKLKFFLWCLFFFIVQVYNDFLPGYFLVFSFAIFSLFFYFFNKKYWSHLFQWKVFFASLVTIAIVIPIALPYFAVSKKYDSVRNIRDAIHYAIQPEDLLVTDENSRMNSLLTFFHHDPSYPSYAEVQPAFLGVVFTLLSIVTIVYFVRQKNKNIIIASLLTTGFLGFILAFGPALHWARRTIHYPFLIPLPYAIFYYIVPGFQGLRNSARFEMLLVITMPIAIAIMLHTVLKGKRYWLQILIYAVLIAGTIGEFPFHMQFPKAPTFAQFPPVYKWIAQNTSKHAVILEVPMYNWDNNPFGNNQEVIREYYSTIHFRNIVGGGSGFSPPPWQQLAINMYNNFPSDKTLQAAKNIGVNYIIVHKGEYDFLNKTHWTSRSIGVPDGNAVLTYLNNSLAVTLITNFGEDYVYQLRY